MYILGISCYYHDASAALLKDGMIVAAAEEERFTRKKHDTSFPINAIKYCLKSQGITINDVSYVGFYEKPFLKFERVLSQHMEMFPLSLKTFLSSLPSWINEKLRVTRKIRKTLKYKGNILFVEHHLAHAASSFLVSPFQKAAILTVDGVGEWTTTAYGMGNGNDIHLMKEIKFPHSLGLLYSAITAYLGFSVNNSEYKCLHPETPVLLSNGDLVAIKNLFSLPGKKKSLSNNEEISALRHSVEVLAFDKDNLKLTPQKTNTVYRKKASTQLYEVELLSGRKVTVTPNHKFASVSSFGEIYDIDAELLKKSDFVAVPKINDKKIKRLIGADIFFDQVKSIKKIKFDGYVYDLLVPKYHTFVGGFGGIVLHNTMGLSPYGNMNRETNRYYQKLMRVIDVKEDGSYRLDMDYFVYHYADRMPSKKLCELLEGPVREKESMLTQRHKDIAAALQMVYEDVTTKMLNHVHKATKCDNLVVSGGCGLNSVYNGKILGKTPFKKIWIQPNSSDGGTSLGVVSYIYHTLLGQKRNYHMTDAYLGPRFSASEIKYFLDKNNIKYSEFKDDKDIVKTAAKLVFGDNVIGWFNGGMEWGPRALGARSILSNPCNPKMQEILNLKVKHRECYDDKTEILTGDGWKLFKELDGKEEVATLNPDTNELVYQQIERKTEYGYHGKMVHFKNNRIDLLVTPEHRVWAKKILSHDKKYSHSKDFEFETAINLLGKEHTQIKGIKKWKGEEKKYFVLPKIKVEKFSHLTQVSKIPMDLWLEFLGYYLSEGCFCYDGNHYFVYVAQHKKSKHYKKIEKCLNKLFKWQYNSGGFRISNKQLYGYLKQFGKAKDKFIPKELLKLSERQLRILFDALMCGDGTYRPTQYKYATVSKRLADDVQELALKLGYATYTSVEKSRNVKHNDIRYVRINMGSKISYVRKEQTRLEGYHGKVYCVSVPKYHVLCVRRNGKAVFSGNSFRPFAPVVCDDDALDYFECDNEIPEPTDFMLMVYPIRKEFHKKIPAVTHVDGSGRLQTIRRHQNPLYYDLVKEFGRLSGIPIMINTSFNIRGEPIVCTPYDAYKCMMGTGIDYLVMGRFLIKREDNPQDMWDSEKYAKD